MPGRAFDIVVSDTPAAASLSEDLVTLCRRAAEIALLDEPEKLDEAGAPPPGRAVIEVSLTLTDDRGIRELNRRYLGRDSATDVLSFFMGNDTSAGDGLAPGNAPFLLGDVIVSVETARRQAGEYGRPFSEELSRLIVHGVLHLAGYDDDTRAGALEMHNREDAVLSKLGFQP